MFYTSNNSCIKQKKKKKKTLLPSGAANLSRPGSLTSPVQVLPRPGVAMRSFSADLLKKFFTVLILTIMEQDSEKELFYC
jgi:hypothetical protein